MRVIGIKEGLFFLLATARFGFQLNEWVLDDIILLGSLQKEWNGSLRSQKSQVEFSISGAYRVVFDKQFAVGDSAPVGYPKNDNLLVLVD